MATRKSIFDRLGVNDNETKKSATKSEPKVRLSFDTEKMAKPVGITADVSGEAWTRATPSQTKIKTKSLDTSVGGFLYDKEPSDKNSLAHKAWENQQKYSQLTKETPTTDPLERAQQQKTERVNSLINKYDEKAYQDTFIGQTKANYGLGRLTQDQSKAWNDYLDNPTAENRKKAEALDNVIRNFQINNQSALDDEGAVLPWISKSAANYVPQLIDQTKAEIGGGAVGALAGGFIAGGAGAAKGAKAGAAAASGLYSYQTMRGAAFRNLLDLGVDEKTARDLANDEGFINGLIEAGDTAVDLLTLGGGSLINWLTKDGLKKAATKAGKSAAVKAAKVLGGLALNVASEYTQEGLQEGVTISNEKRAQAGIDNGKTGLVKDTAGLFYGLTQGQNPVVGQKANGEDLLASERIGEAAKEGAKIALMMGGGTLAVNYGVPYVADE